MYLVKLPYQIWPWLIDLYLIVVEQSSLIQDFKAQVLIVNNQVNLCVGVGNSNRVFINKWIKEVLKDRHIRIFIIFNLQYVYCINLAKWCLSRFHNCISFPQSGRSLQNLLFFPFGEKVHSIWIWDFFTLLPFKNNIPIKIKEFSNVEISIYSRAGFFIYLFEDFLQKK